MLVIKFNQAFSNKLKLLPGSVNFTLSKLTHLGGREIVAMLVEKNTVKWVPKFLSRFGTS